MSMYASMYAMLFWIIPTNTTTLDMIISALLIYIPLIGTERNIILKANNEEKEYIDALKEKEEKDKHISKQPQGVQKSKTFSITISTTKRN